MLRPLLMVAMMTTAASSMAASLPNTPVRTLDLSRYVGQWHEIAHLPMYFQRQCVGDITATYTRLADGSIGVHNACRTATGKMDASDGVAHTTDQPGASRCASPPPGWAGCRGYGRTTG